MASPGAAPGTFSSSLGAKASQPVITLVDPLAADGEAGHGASWTDASFGQQPPSPGIVPPSRPETPTTIHSAAQRGDLATIKSLIESGRATAQDRDEEGITPLHWASINAQLPVCVYLLDQGADVDALGGELVASPLQWAARSGHIYIIHLLLSRGADPLLKDAQGFNSLHLVTHSSAVMPLVYLLQQPAFGSHAESNDRDALPNKDEGIDAEDAQGHTALMWAAYQGDAISVELLILHGASLYTQDHLGLSPMHWAVVKGNRLCIRQLAVAGADMSMKQNEGKTPREMAIELKSLPSLEKALADAGYCADGSKRRGPLNPRNTKVAILLLPFFFLGLIFWTFSILPWYTGLLLAMAEFFCMHHIITRVLLDPQEAEFMQKSPYFLAIVSDSIAWVGIEWGVKLVRGTPGLAIWNLFFFIVFLLCSWNLLLAASMEPGYALQPQTETERRLLVEQLLEEYKLNGQNFCVICMCRRPLRSKHCKLCKRCVARHDHHCPWVSNCIGAENHRQFLVFIASLVVGIIIFLYLSYAYYAANLPADTLPVSSCILPASICAATSWDTFLFATSAWAALQLIWTIILLGAQLLQISRQMTTLEVSNLGRYGYMGGKGGSSMVTQSNFMAQRAAALGAAGSLAAAAGGHEDSDGDGVAGRGSHGAHGGHRGGKRCFLDVLCGASNCLLSVVGLDLYTRGKAGEGLKRASAAGNPFDKGVLANCKDFWTRGRELGVRYEELYDIPVGGFQSSSYASASAVRLPDDGPGGTGRRWSMWSGLKQGLGGRGSRARGEYEAVSDQA
ncbi:ankyrin [Tilletiaria anomala UBC 951]|uniref:Palmitoyltransferase n=1 Tax=Tilletiaria anomala (strain ATCC 24038 / CBS 436.72 / UBC 951) TaxID=1037660 RepID=A0A066W763_TILAU|nr:ankyrin [Tilletiaria anomala UBC 951]KDN46635.1 ankyrin [Tilletiaria anomala UBC 951]